MDWDVRPKRTEKRPAAASSSTVPMDAHIRVARERLLREKAEAPAMRGRARRIRDRAAELEGRRFLRVRLDMEEEASTWERRADRLVEDGHVREYEERLTPFLDAYARCDQGARRGEGEEERERRRPGGKASARPQQERSTNAQSRIVSEYLTEVCHQAPRVDVEREESCVRCEGKMLLEPTKAIITCVKCGYSASYLDATCSALSFGDDVVMSTIFSYKRLNHFQEHLAACQGIESMRVPPDV